MSGIKKIDWRAHQLVSVWLKIQERLFEEEPRSYEGRPVEMILVKTK